MWRYIGSYDESLEEQRVILLYINENSDSPIVAIESNLGVFDLPQ